MPYGSIAEKKSYSNGHPYGKPALGSPGWRGGSAFAAMSGKATGDTMNSGAIYIHGSAGDALGTTMRAGKILIQEMPATGRGS